MSTIAASAASTKRKRVDEFTERRQRRAVIQGVFGDLMEHYQETMEEIVGPSGSRLRFFVERCEDVKDLLAAATDVIDSNRDWLTENGEASDAMEAKEVETQTLNLDTAQLNIDEVTEEMLKEVSELMPSMKGEVEYFKEHALKVCESLGIEQDE